MRSLVVTHRLRPNRRTSRLPFSRACDRAVSLSLDHHVLPTHIPERVCDTDGNYPAHYRFGGPVENIR